MDPRPLTPGERAFLRRAVRRTRLFLALSIVGVAFAVALAAVYVHRWWTVPGYPIGIRIVVVILILLNARQNLRQHRCATLLSRLELATADRRAEAGDRPVC